MNPAAKSKKTGKDAPIKKKAARMLAAQALYQQIHNPQPAALLANEYLSTRTAMSVEGEGGQDVMALPDGVHFKKVVIGADKAQGDLSALIAVQMKKDGQEAKEPELLLKAILLCGAYELVYLQGIDSPIIINDYVDVAHGFYEGGEAKLVNAVLDKIAKTVR